MSRPEQYLKPEVIRQVARLDLRAKFIVEGFLAGLHASPYHGFSVEFSEHRKYVAGDDLKDLDWSVYAKTERYYVKKYQAETNMTGYLVVDLNNSMNWASEHTKRDAKESLTKFEYAISLAAALGYMMISQQDPVGVVACGPKIQASVPPKSARSQLGTILALLSKAATQEETNLPFCLHQLAAMTRSRSLVMIFSDLYTHPEEDVMRSLHLLRHRGHDIILFHILDHAERAFPYDEPTKFEWTEKKEQATVDARGIRDSYLDNMNAFRDYYKDECARSNIDFVEVDTSVDFSKALMEYLVQRQKRF